MDPGHRDRNRVHCASLRPLCQGMPCSRGASARRCGWPTRSLFSSPPTAAPEVSARRRHHRPATPRTITSANTMTEGERLTFPASQLAPEMFPALVLRDPMRMKALQKGLTSCARGRTQVFRPLRQQRPDPGAVACCSSRSSRSGCRTSIGLQASMDNVNVYTARWIYCEDAKKLAEFRPSSRHWLSITPAPRLPRPSRVNLQLTLERWPDVHFP